MCENRERESALENILVSGILGRTSVPWGMRLCVRLCGGVNKQRLGKRSEVHPGLRGGA